MEYISDCREKARKHLERYLYVLERQYESIQLDDVETLEFYLREGQETLAALRAVQKVIHGAGAVLPEEDDLTERVRRQHRSNRDLLIGRRDELGRRIEAVNVPRRARSVFQAAMHGGSMVDMSM
ncbi:MAG: hypothetical protein EA427_12495 [Spirochaetaceae bacterium]|nr:MAG: hypothetical protein EA427_12495 [Spirochaetaceae bacterium]